MRHLKSWQTGLFGMLTILFIFSPLLVSAQESVKEGLFRETNVLLQDAKKVEANLYSPKYFEKGLELYNKAERDFKDGKKLENIRKKLREASIQLKKSIEITRLAKITLEEITQSRKAAVAQDATQWAPDKFAEAEKLFRKAAEKMEDGKPNDAKKIATEGSKLYREIELIAIKTRILDEAWRKLKECEDKQVEKYAPLTLDKAKSHAASAASTLDQDRYDQDKAKIAAEEAAYEARHALFLAETIRSLQNQKDGMENYILDVEHQFQRISEALNMDMEFDGGFQGPAYKMVETILELREKGKKQRNKIEELSKTVDELSTELNGLKSGQLKELSGKLKELESIVAKEKAAKERFERVKQNFSPDEAKVIQESDNVIIRLYGINFPSGRAIIHPEYFPLLTKVIRSIEEFPNCHVRIEGHTDSRGSNAVNEKLSTDRANSVLQYITANSNLDQSMVTGIGYGEDRPIASNDTEEGRALNRRIDVVIIPNK